MDRNLTSVQPCYMLAGFGIMLILAYVSSLRFDMRVEGSENTKLVASVDSESAANHSE